MGNSDIFWTFPVRLGFTISMHIGYCRGGKYAYNGGMPTKRKAKRKSDVRRTTLLLRNETYEYLRLLGRGVRQYNASAGIELLVELHRLAEIRNGGSQADRPAPEAPLNSGVVK